MTVYLWMFCMHIMLSENQFAPILSFSPTVPPTDESTAPTTSPTAPPSFDVAFRMDEVQDYFCTQAQIAIIKAFQKLKIPLTIGIIAYRFGAQTSHLRDIKALVQSTESSVEVASNGWEYEDFSRLDGQNQSRLLQISKEKIENVLKNRWPECQSFCSALWFNQ